MGRLATDASRDEVVGSFDDFEPEVRALVKVNPLRTLASRASLRNVTQLCEKPSKWALHVVEPLPFCVRKRVALIGDAVRSHPHLCDGMFLLINDAP